MAFPMPDEAPVTRAVFMTGYRQGPREGHWLPIRIFRNFDLRQILQSWFPAGSCLIEVEWERNHDRRGVPPPVQEQWGQVRGGKVGRIGVQEVST